MRPIQMVDTHSQYLAIKSEVDAAIHEVLDTAAYINGKAVQQFTQSLGEYLQVKHTIPCANGTDALQIAMMALGLQPGDEVITPSFTYIATTEVVALLKLTPVFVEVDPQTFETVSGQAERLKENFWRLEEEFSDLESEVKELEDELKEVEDELDEKEASPHQDLCFAEVELRAALDQIWNNRMSFAFDSTKVKVLTSLL